MSLSHLPAHMALAVPGHSPLSCYVCPAQHRRRSAAKRWFDSWRPPFFMDGLSGHLLGWSLRTTWIGYDLHIFYNILSNNQNLDISNFYKMKKHYIQFVHPPFEDTNVVSWRRDKRQRIQCQSRSSSLMFDMNLVSWTTTRTVLLHLHIFYI